MLDIEVVVDADPYADALTIVSLAEMKKHLHINHSKLDDQITAAIQEAVAAFDFRDGVLNRSVLQRRIKRYLHDYPSCAPYGILLPYPPVTEVLSITTIDGAVVIDPASYTIKYGLIPTIFPADRWPSITSATRGVEIEYEVGYDTVPPALKRLVKTMAGHYMENPEGTINEPRQMMINRKVEYGIDFDLGRLRIPTSYDDWE